MPRVREFKGDGIFNIFCRAYHSLKIRLRGWLYLHLGVFSTSKMSRLILGSSPTIKNGRAILINGRIKFGNFARLECFNVWQPNEKDSFKIEIGGGSSFGNNFHCGACNFIRIGENVLVGSHVLIIDHSHGNPKDYLHRETSMPPVERELYSKGGIVIGNNVWICDAVTILPGAVIGDGSVISANSVVAGAVEPYSIYYGTRKS